jgi:translation initiation factor 1A
MPKNKGKGGKNRKRGKNENLEDSKRELVYKTEGQDYAQVIRMLGGGHVEALCFGDNKKRVCHIRGKMRKKIWINKSDIILVGRRFFEDDKADVILKYTNDEARDLQRYGEIPENANLSEAVESGLDTGIDNIFFDEYEAASDESDVEKKVVAYSHKKSEDEDESEELESYDDELIETI